MRRRDTDPRTREHRRRDVSDLTPTDPVGREAARRARARRFIPAIAVLVGVVAIGLFVFRPTPACACGPSEPPPLSSPIVGVVTAVDSAGLGQVKSFVLRLPDASTITFSVGPLENATQFSPSHLAEHIATSEPVRVFFRTENGALVVYRLEDAAAAAPS